MAKDEDDVMREALSGAMIATNREIAAEAWGKDDLVHDETGDRSLEGIGAGLEGQVEDEENLDDDAGGDEGGDKGAKPEGNKTEQTTLETKPDGKTTTQAAPETDAQGRVPAGRHREEAERRRAAEAERDTLKTRIEASEKATQELIAKAVAEANAAAQQRFDAAVAAVLRGQQQPRTATEAPQAPKMPDPLEDPEGYRNFILKEVEDRHQVALQQANDERVNASLFAARERHGATFDEAWKSLASLDYSNPANRAFVKRMNSLPNPGDAVVSWHKRNVAARTVGDDLDAYNKRIREQAIADLKADPEFRKSFIEDLRGEAFAGDSGKPRTTTKIPPALGRVSGGNSRGAMLDDSLDGSEQSIAASAWG